MGDHPLRKLFPGVHSGVWKVGLIRTALPGLSALACSGAQVRAPGDMPMTSPPATYAPASWLYPVDLSVQLLIAAGELLQPNRRQAWREETHVHGLR